MVGTDGKVKIWDLVAKAWTRRYPIDAREMIAIGVAQLEEPAPAPAVKPGGGKDDGAKEASREGSQQEQDDEQQAETQSQSDVTVSGMTKAELLQALSDAGVTASAAMSKSQLIAMLENARADG